MASAGELLYEQRPYDSSNPISYEDWREDAASRYFDTGSGWSDFWRGFISWPKLFNGNDKDIGRKGYEAYLDKFYRQQDLNNASIAEYNQRKYDEYMSNTAYQRAYKDIQATGLNPAILLTSAFGPASHGNSAQAYSISSKSSTSKSESDNRNNSATAVLAAVIALLAKALI